jgi:DNA-binding PadR family transcriptional regulator
VSRPIPLREPTFHILAALAAEDAHGYRLIKAVEDLSDGRIVLRAGTLYGALARLEADGHVEAVGTSKAGGPARRTYRLTEQGRQLLWSELQRLEANVAMARSQMGRTAGT